MTNVPTSSSLLPQVQAAPRRMLDRYELIAEIARGGMGTVLLARLAGAGGFKRLYAIKLLHGHLAADKLFVDMLLDEARLASSIHHSNAVPIVDVCDSPLGLYVVMDYVEGFPFGKLLGAPEITPRERIRTGCQVLLGVLDGLEAAHNLTDEEGNPLGLVHRDVSPSNVILGLDGVGRILDFGVAHAGSRITHTDPGTIKGKLAYMAPEQCRGERVDRRADVFAVGIMLWECLTGRRLFKAENDASTVMRLLNDPILPPSTFQGAVPAELDAVVLRALDRNVNARYQSARELARDLHRVAERSGFVATSSETEELLQSRFAEEIRERRLAIRQYCGMLAGGSGPIIIGEPPPQLPRLSDKRPPMPTPTPTPSSQMSAAAVPRHVEAIGQAPTMPNTPVPMPSPVLREVETRAQRRQASDSVPSLLLDAAAAAPSRRWLVWAGVALALLVAAGVAAVLRGSASGPGVTVTATNGTAPAANGTGGVAARPAANAPGATTVGAPATANAPGATTVAAPGAAAAAAPASAPGAAPVTTVVMHELPAANAPAAAPAGAHVTPARRPQRAAAPATSPVAKPAAAPVAKPAAAPARSRPTTKAPAGSDEPALEMNPYLHR